jgi:exosortase/archaeosortase family protein
MSREARHRKQRARAAKGGSSKPTLEAQPSRPGAASPLLGLRFPLVAALIAVPLLALYFYPYDDGGAISTRIQSYLAVYARAAGAVVGLFDSHVVVKGTTISGSLFSMQIVKTCDAMEVNILLLAAIAAFPMPWRRRIASVLLAIPALALANLCRLCVLYWLGAHIRDSFDRVHQTVAPIFMVASALVIFLLATRTRQRKSRGSHEPLVASETTPS